MNRDLRSRLAALIAAMCALMTIGVATTASGVEPHATTGAGLFAFTNTPATSGSWAAGELTAPIGAPGVVGTPVAVGRAGLLVICYRSVSNRVQELVFNPASRTVVSSADLAVLAHAPLIGSDPTVFTGADGSLEIAYRAINGHLVLVTDRYVSKHPWQVIDLTSATGGPRISGPASATITGTVTTLYARSQGGDLFSFSDQPVRSAPWKAVDLTLVSGGPAIAADPVAAVDHGPGGVTYVAALAPTGHLVVFVNDNTTKRLWSVRDLTVATGASMATVVPVIVSTPHQLRIYGRDGQGHLWEVTGLASSLPAQWSARDLTSLVTGAPVLVGRPAAVIDGNALTIVVRSQYGDLFSLNAPITPGALPVSSDLTITENVIPQGGGSLFAAVAGASIITLTGGRSAPAPTGTGVYAIPQDTYAKAVTDGWPVLGVTGALGTQTAPYTGLFMGQDELAGKAIQASHARTTWLSFWTVSGPPGANPSPTAYYGAGFAAGGFVAKTIDKYASDGLSLKPDYVILDPEGYPDNHSGLDGPAKSALFIAKWKQILQGWTNGLLAIDPTLRPAVYLDQYEYNSYGISTLPIPAFLAVAYTITTANKTVCKKDPAGKCIVDKNGKPIMIPVLDAQGNPITILSSKPIPPTRTAANGANVRGVVSFNDFCPSEWTNAGDYLAQTTQYGKAPWNGQFNTLQFLVTPSVTQQYCPPR